MDDDSRIKKQVEVLEYSTKMPTSKSIEVIREFPLTISFDSIPVITVMFNGQNPKELTVGHMFMEGRIESAQDIRKIEFYQENSVCNVQLAPKSKSSAVENEVGTLASSGARGAGYSRFVKDIREGRVKVGSPIQVDIHIVEALSRQVLEGSALRKATHGVHAAALANDKEILIFREDIGRHNAIDKVAGRCLLDGTSRKDKILFTTGRLSSEMMIKAARLGVPVFVSCSAVTELALDIANKVGLTIIGNAGRGKPWVFLGAQNVKG